MRFMCRTPVRYGHGIPTACPCIQGHNTYTLLFACMCIQGHNTYSLLFACMFFFRIYHVPLPFSAEPMTSCSCPYSINENCKIFQNNWPRSKPKKKKKKCKSFGNDNRKNHFILHVLNCKLNWIVFPFQHSN